MRYRESTARTKFDSEYSILPEKQCGTERVPSERLARRTSQACTRIAGQPEASVLVPGESIPNGAEKSRAETVPLRAGSRDSRAQKLK